MAVGVLKAGPGVTVQDMGRPGLLHLGLSRGGAMDRLALIEGAALLGQPVSLAALEIAGSFVTLQAACPLRIALTGAQMRATCEGMPLIWNAAHAIPAGARLEIAALAGGYGYVHIGGGIDVPVVLNSRSTHLAAGLGQMLAAGDTLPVGHDSGFRTGLMLDPLPRFDGGLIRVVAGPQTALFDPATLARFEATEFTRDARGNRMGQRLVGGQFGTPAGLSIVSDIVLPGDIQITGDGTPFVLTAECQTTGGYPRLATVLPCDLPRLVQAPVGAVLRFAFVAPQTGLALVRAEAARQGSLRASLRALLRDPRDIPDLLSYQLISGATNGDDLET